MRALETSIESLTAEHTTLTQKLEQIDQQYRVERPVVVSQISQLARALSALTGKTVAGPGGHLCKSVSRGKHEISGRARESAQFI
jgi:hypothetical protein